MDDNAALTAQDVAYLLKIAKNTVYELVKRGELNHYKVGRKMRFSRPDVENYIAGARAGRLNWRRPRKPVSSSAGRTPYSTF
jgi:putative molybdopterin biosynthesis protein